MVNLYYTLQAHLELYLVKDLDKISTFTNHAKVIEGPVAILCNFNLMNEDK